MLKGPVVFELEHFSCNLVCVSFSGCFTGMLTWPNDIRLSFSDQLLGIYCVFTMIILEGINFYFGTPLKSNVM